MNKIILSVLVLSVLLNISSATSTSIRGTTKLGTTTQAQSQVQVQTEMKGQTKEKMEHQIHAKATSWMELKGEDILPKQRVEQFEMEDMIDIGHVAVNTEFWEARDTKNNNQVVWCKFYFKTPSPDSTEKLLIKRSDLDVDPENKFIHEYCKKLHDFQMEKFAPKTELIASLQLCLNPGLPPKPIDPDNPPAGAPPANDETKATQLTEFKQYMNIPLYNAFEVPAGYDIKTYCKLRARCFNQQFLKIVARGALQAMKETDNYVFDSFNDQNMFYDFDNEKIILTNIFNGEKVYPDGFEKPTSATDMSHLGVLLTKLAIRKEAETNEKLIEELKPCVAPKDLYKVIHGNDAEGDANFAGTIYELIMKLLGKHIPKQNAVAQFTDSDSALGDPFFSAAAKPSDRASDLGADFGTLNYLAPPAF